MSGHQKEATGRGGWVLVLGAPLACLDGKRLFECGTGLALADTSPGSGAFFLRPLVLLCPAVDIRSPGNTSVSGLATSCGFAIGSQ